MAIKDCGYRHNLFTFQLILTLQTRISRSTGALCKYKVMATLVEESITCGGIIITDHYKLIKNLHELVIENINMAIAFQRIDFVSVVK